MKKSAILPPKILPDPQFRTAYCVRAFMDLNVTTLQLQNQAIVREAIQAEEEEEEEEERIIDNDMMLSVYPKNYGDRCVIPQTALRCFRLCRPCATSPLQVPPSAVRAATSRAGEDLAYFAFASTHLRQGYGGQVGFPTYAKAPAGAP